MTTGSNPSPGFRKHPEHKISVGPYRGHVSVKSDGTVIASSDSALLLKEDRYPPVLYIPFTDIDFSTLSPTNSETHCPFKGDASYWNRKEGGEDVMWAYQHPFDEMRQIKDYGAFYPERVNVEAADD